VEGRRGIEARRLVADADWEEDVENPLSREEARSVGVCSSS
jgi:hypothetical protein